MTEDVQTVGSEDPVETALMSMKNLTIRTLPVVDKESRLQGMVTLADIVDVIHQEATEDVAQMAGTTAEDVDRTASSWQAALSRAWRLLPAIVGGGNKMDVVGSLKEGASTIMLDGYCLFEGKLTKK